MKYFLLALLLGLAAINSIAQTAKAPPTKKVEQTDDYFGTKVSDPYRWLEDDNSAETKTWVDVENKVTFDYLNKINYRPQVKERLTNLWNFEKRTTPFKKAGMLFCYENNGIQDQNVLYVTNSKTLKKRVLLDPNKLSADGTVSIGSVAVSKGGKYLAYTYSKAGSDWSQIKVIAIKDGKLLSDQINWIKFSGIEWKGDEGFYYSRYDEPTKGTELSGKNEFQKVVFHKLGTDPKNDELVYNDPNFPTRGFYGGLSDDENYLMISGTESTSGNSLFIKDLKNQDRRLIRLVESFSDDYNVLDIIEGKAFILTNNKASNKKVIAVDLTNPSIEKADVIIPETKDLLESVTVANKCLILNYLHDVSSKIEVHDLKGNLLHELKLPGIGKVNSINFDKKDTLGYIDFSTFTAPTAIYKYNVKSNKLKLHFKAKTSFKSDEYETKQVFYTSKDGTKIPMFIISKKGIKLDGNNPCFLFGYGGFSVNYSPEFRIDRCLFLEQGGVYAVPGLRGGGEYGEDWHKAGTIFNKQNVFDDFISAAEYLCAEKYTNKNKLAIHGRSNGGLLIGAVMTQRPDICKVAIPTVGVLDMLRYHTFTIGWAWATDYGTSADEKQFQNLIKYSPLHNVKKANYPATFITTGDHDDRVVPAHSFKFAATLQENNTSEEPILIRIDKNAGHGAGKPTTKQIEEYADMWSFVFYNLGMKPKY
ncbi:MAG: prolyl oligopeptidase family serine peptidase [Bacteroidota bacterium]|nr:prolyl oligopeptidase family serine peptidase [Bacteroidota bacterium]